MQKNKLLHHLNPMTFAWIVWGLAATFYFSDYLARVAPGVMHRYLQEAFNINESGFGTLTASFYIPYVLMQIPVGLTVDRASIRKILTMMSIITAFGCVVFGLAQGLLDASIGRMLIGFSAAFAFVSSLRLATSWFPPAMLGLLAGLTQALGMLGAAAGEAPVSFLVAAVGWRNTMFIMAILFIVLAIFLYNFIQDTPDGSLKKSKQKLVDPESLRIMQSLKVVLSHKQTWLNALYAGFLFVPTAVIGEAIGPAYLQYGQHLGAHAAAFATGLIFIGWGISGPVSGWISDKISKRKPIMLGSALCGFVLSLIIVFSPSMSTYGAYFLLLMFGVTNTGVAIAYAVSTEIQSEKVIGTTIGFTNMVSIFVGACMQPLVGKLIDSVAGERAFHVNQLLLTDFQSGLKLVPICSLIALVLVFFINETNCRCIRANKQ